MAADRERSVVFGEAVEQHESARPGHPEQLPRALHRPGPRPPGRLT
ncbi:hypothetical protein [Nonomuraea sp. NPDC049784]